MNTDPLPRKYKPRTLHHKKQTCRMCGTAFKAHWSAGWRCPYPWLSGLRLLLAILGGWASCVGNEVSDLGVEGDGTSPCPPREPRAGATISAPSRSIFQFLTRFQHTPAMGHRLSGAEP